MESQSTVGIVSAGVYLPTSVITAAEISRQSGKSIKYVNLSEADYRNALIKAGFPAPVASLIADSDTGASKGALFDESRQLSRLIGHPTTTLAASLTAALRSA